MRIQKVFNNNVVATIDSSGKELIVTGAGVGFRKKEGDKIDESKITQWFDLRDNKKKKFYSLLERTPIEHFEIAEAILEYAEKKLKLKANRGVLISLTDHISFAITRANENLEIPNLILNETCTLYKEEFEIGKWSLDYIEKMTGVRLSDDEAGYITIHIIDATYSHENHSAVDMIDAIKDIISIIEASLNVKIEKDSLSYSRLLIHLKFLVQRIKHDENINDLDSDELYKMLLVNEVNLDKCIKNVDDYIKGKYGYALSTAEKTYLIIHISKIINTKDCNFK